MYCELPTAEATTPTRKRIRELAERTSNGTMMRLFWLEGTRELWVEIREPEFDVTIVIPAEPEDALEAFHHPYAYAAAHKCASSGHRDACEFLISLDDREHRPPVDSAVSQLSNPRPRIVRRARPENRRDRRALRRVASNTD